MIPLNPNEKIVYQNAMIQVSNEVLSAQTCKERIQTEDSLTLVRVYTNPSVHIFPISENKKIWLIQEYRIDEDVTRWLIPGGGLESHQTPEQCAQAELQEELGKKAESFELFYELPYRKKVLNEHRYYFIARGLSDSHVENPDGNVVKDMKEFSIEELKKMTLSGAFNPSPTVFALLQLIGDVESGKVIL
ncbi:hypothetical protein COB57_03720 [Candidatus Peregrinibacteria bacterium]|nr:MAG: hypothetical protein COB57_03720 [Candidatus Peregrinibacteria bacterium]